MFHLCPVYRSKNGISAGAIAGIVIGVIGLLAGIAIIIFLVIRSKRRKNEEQRPVGFVTTAISPMESPAHDRRQPPMGMVMGTGMGTGMGMGMGMAHPHMMGDSGPSGHTANTQSFGQSSGDINIVTHSSEAIVNSAMNSKQRMMQEQQRNPQHSYPHQSGQPSWEQLLPPANLPPVQAQAQLQLQGQGQGQGYGRESSSGSGTLDTLSTPSVPIFGYPQQASSSNPYGQPGVWNSQGSLPHTAPSITTYPPHVRMQMIRDPVSVNPSQSGAPESAYGGMGSIGSVIQRPESAFLSDAGTAPPPYQIPQTPMSSRSPPLSQPSSHPEKG